MASMEWEKVGRRWRVFWHVTLSNGSVDIGIKEEGVEIITPQVVTVDGFEI